MRGILMWCRQMKVKTTWDLAAIANWQLAIMQGSRINGSAFNL